MGGGERDIAALKDLWMYAHTSKFTLVNSMKWKRVRAVGTPHLRVEESREP